MASESTPLVNKVAQSGLITIRPEDWFPKTEIQAFDLKDYLWKALILKEKDFRQALKAHDWEQYEGKILAVHCSADAIIPMWAYMLVAAYAQPLAKDVFYGTKADYIDAYFATKIEQLDTAPYEEKRLVIKGCGEIPVPPSAYLNLTKKLRPIALSIMYGEPCSTVPIYKRPRK